MIHKWAQLREIVSPCHDAGYTMDCDSARFVTPYLDTSRLSPMYFIYTTFENWSVVIFIRLVVIWRDITINSLDYKESRSSSVTIVTRLQVGRSRLRGVIDGKVSRSFSSFKRPGRLWRLHSLLFSGYRGRLSGG